MKLSVVIPARDEGECIAETLSGLACALKEAGIPYEAVVVDDGSADDTAAVVRNAARSDPAVRLVSNAGPNGYGRAVRLGLSRSTGGAVVVMMADGSDDPRDVPLYYAKLKEGYDCVFGSRFVPGGRRDGYPAYKLILNRAANLLIRLLFGFAYDDTTNAFKGYARGALDRLEPLVSPDFGLTVEMPLNAVVRGCRYCVVPVGWRNRERGASKLVLRKMAGSYLAVVLRLWLQKIRPAAR
jgi:dolichol-phosphate mannosyltransferase